MDGSQVASAIKSATIGSSFFVSADTSSAISALDDLQDSAKSVGDTMTALGAAVGALAAASGAAAINLASTGELADLSFTKMLGSATASEELMENLSDFAVSTPFNFSTLVTTSKQMLALGFDANSIIPDLQAVGDAVAAYGSGDTGMSNIMLDLGKMNTSAKASARYMNDLASNHVKSWQYVADALGETTSEVKTQVTAGAISAQTAIDAIISGMERDYGGMMQMASTTVSGVINNLQDALQRPFILEAPDTTGYKNLETSLQSLIVPLENLTESFLPLFSDILNKLSGVINGASGQLSGLSTSLANMSSYEMDAVEGLGVFVITIGPMLLAFSKLTGGVKDFSSAMLGPLLTAGKQAKSGITGLEKTIDSLASKTEKSKQTISTTVDGVTTTVEKNVSTTTKSFSNFVSNFGSSIDKASSKYVKFFSSLSSFEAKSGAILPRGVALSMTAATEGLGVAFAGTEKYTTAMLKLFAGFSRGAISFSSAFGMIALGASIGAIAFQAMGGSMSDLLSGVTNAVIGFGQLAQAMIGGIINAAPSVVSALEEYGPTLMSTITNVVQTIVDSLPGLLSAVGNVFNTMVPLLAQLLVSNIPTLLGVAIELFTGLIDGLTTVINTLAPMMPQLIL